MFEIKTQTTKQMRVQTWPCRERPLALARVTTFQPEGGVVALPAVRVLTVPLVYTTCIGGEVLRWWTNSNLINKAPEKHSFSLI